MILKEGHTEVFFKSQIYNFAALSGGIPATSNISDQQTQKCYLFLNTQTCGNRIPNLYGISCLKALV